MKLLVYAVAMGLTISLSPIHATQRDLAAGQPLTVSEVVEEISLQQAEIDAAVAPIKSRNDLARYLRVNPESPINKLPSDVRNRFLSKLVFTKRGLGSYSYLGLSGHLSVTEMYGVMSLFGQQRSVHRIPKLAPKNGVEESMLFAQMGSNPKPNMACIVDGQSPDGDTSWCTPEYGSMCNGAC